jgi:hypothetical protein
MKIVIKGESKEGKSIIAKIISNALLQHHIYCHIEDADDSYSYRTSMSQDDITNFWRGRESICIKVKQE